MLFIVFFVVLFVIGNALVFSLDNDENANYQASQPYRHNNLYSRKGWYR